MISDHLRRRPITRRLEETRNGARRPVEQRLLDSVRRADQSHRVQGAPFRPSPVNPARAAPDE